MLLAELGLEMDEEMLLSEEIDEEPSKNIYMPGKIISNVSLSEMHCNIPPEIYRQHWRGLL